jgi:hypothetical protein
MNVRLFNWNKVNHGHQHSTLTIMNKIKWVILPSLLVIGIGILEIQYPHAMDGFDDAYTGHGKAGFIMLLLELFLMLTWGKVGGVLAIWSGMLAIVTCFLPNKEQAIECKTNKNSSLASLTFRAGKDYVQRHRKMKSN